MPTSFRAVASSIVLLAAAESSSAAAPYEGCFVRTYDAAHLAAHKRQTVAAIKLRLTPRKMEDPLTVAAEMRLDVRGRDGAFYAVGACREQPQNASCGLDQDAGKISLTPGANGLLMSIVQDVRADAASGEESDFVTVRLSNPEDRTFALAAASAESCKEFEDSDAAEGEGAPD